MISALATLVVALPLMCAATGAWASGAASTSADPAVALVAARQEIAELRERLAVAEERINALLFGLGLSAVTGLVVGRLGRRRDREPMQPPAAAEPSRGEAARLHPPEVADTAPASLPLAVAGPDTAPAVGPHEPAPVLRQDEPSAEEHDDIDQQAEFLLVLGQDEAAIDLLLDHLRGTGGTSPLPYLRLMQIYRQRGDEPAYERTRERFNQRFNAIAPEWAAAAGDPRGLEASPEVMASLQSAWPRPLDARALLETLLFRRGSEDERFELPAYEELLFLHGLTRDLLRRGEGPASPIDVLLPIDEAQRQASVIEPVAPARAVPPALAPTMALPRDGAAPRVDVDLSTVPSDPDASLR